MFGIFFNKINGYLYKFKHPVLSKYTDEYYEYLRSLFFKAANSDGFNYICTLLRVEGITSREWDAFVEAEEASRDISKLLRKTGKSKRSLRLALFLYCHLTEMSAPYEILANLLRCRQGKNYSMSPFAHLVKINKSKKNPFGWRKLPYPIQKISHIKELSKICHEDRPGKIFDSFFDNNVRNAFYHSDYTITEDEFRIIEGSSYAVPSIKLDELSDKLTRCFAFYSAFFGVFKNIRNALAKDAHNKNFFRWPNYDVLELLTDHDELTGFKIHFPSGSYSMFERKRDAGTMSINLNFSEEGVGFNVGDLEKYKNADDWWVDGKIFDEYGTRYNVYGYWKPIVFWRNSEKIKSKAIASTDNKIVQGCMFYIYATGHRAIEFTIKSDKKLFREREYARPLFKKRKRIVIQACGNGKSKYYIYDGTVFLESVTPRAVEDAINEIEKYIDRHKKNNCEIRYRLKYRLYSDLSSAEDKVGEGGSHFITFRMDDPRNSLVVSDLNYLPKTDWKIKEEWI
jgi:hypothetical protein